MPEHGSPGGYTAHRRAHEPPCAVCREGHCQRLRERRAEAKNPKVRPVVPAAVAPLPEFDDGAVCRQIGIEAYFPDKGSSNRRAKTACHTCPFEDPCLSYALAWNLQGIWGGTSEYERRKMQKAAGITPRSLTQISGRVTPARTEDVA